MYLIWLGLRLFVLGNRITIAQKLVNWRVKYVKNYSDPILLRLKKHHSRMSNRFIKLEQQFKEKSDGEK